MSRLTVGCDILDILLYLRLLYAKQFNQYFLHKTDQYDRLPYLLLMENHARRVFNSKLGLKISTRNRICLNRRIFINDYYRSLINTILAKMKFKR